MADLSHELDALRFVVDSPLSSKVAMFNNQVSQHKQSQLLNPFAQTDGRVSPKPTFSKDQYGKPLAGSLTEMRGQKANMHVLREMLELCQIIDSEGYDVKDEPDMRVIPFGELFNIYNYISDKCVGILLRARKHKLVEFEGEMLFQRRDDNVPIFLLRPVSQIRRELNDKIESIKRAGSPAPQATSVILDKKAHGLDVPRGGSSTNVSRTSTPQSSKASSPARDNQPAPEPINVEKPKIQISREPEAETKTEEPKAAEEMKESVPQVNQKAETTPQVKLAAVEVKDESDPAAENETCPVPATQVPDSQHVEDQITSEGKTTEVEHKNDVNNNPAAAAADLPVVVIEASAVYVRAGIETETQVAADSSTMETVTTTESSVPTANAPTPDVA